jgi:hypothetical protein
MLMAIRPPPGPARASRSGHVDIFHPPCSVITGAGKPVKISKMTRQLNWPCVICDGHVIRDAGRYR